MRKVFTGITALLLAAVAVQFFLAGRGFYGQSLDPHRALGFLTLLLGVIAVLVGAVAKVGRRILGMSGLVVVLLLLQPVIAQVAHGIEEASTGALVFGLHALNGLVIAALLGVVFRASRSSSAAHPAPAPEGVAAA